MTTKFPRVELEAAFQEIFQIAAAEHDDMRVRLTALNALRVSKDFRCVEIGVRLLISSGDDLPSQQVTEILYYISPFFGSERFAGQVQSLSQVSDLKKALEKLRQRNDKVLVEASTRLLNGLPQSF